MILVDTNVFSELQKTRPDPKAVDWLHAHRAETLLLTVVIAEVRLGISISSGQRKRIMLIHWLDRLISAHSGQRTLAFDTAAALRYGEIMAVLQLQGRHAGVQDGMLAAQALAHGCRLATRNAKHFQHEELELVDPWTF